MKKFLRKNPFGINEDDFFNMKAGPSGFTEMFGVEEKPQEKDKETQIINYRGIREAEIEKITKQDTRDFRKYMSIVSKLNMYPSEELFIKLNLWSKEKTWYMYDKWIKKYGYPENNIED